MGKLLGGIRQPDYHVLDNGGRLYQMHGELLFRLGVIVKLQLLRVGRRGEVFFVFLEKMAWESERIIAAYIR